MGGPPVPQFFFTQKPDVVVATGDFDVSDLSRRRRAGARRREQERILGRLARDVDARRIAAEDPEIRRRLDERFLGPYWFGLRIGVADLEAENRYRKAFEALRVVFEDNEPLDMDGAVLGAKLALPPVVEDVLVVLEAQQHGVVEVG